MNSNDIYAIWVTLKLAFITTMILLLITLPLAWWLAKTKSKLRLFIDIISSIPLVLPPTVLGFYILILLGPHGPIGKMTNALGLSSFAFSFTGLVLGSVIYSFPFVLQPIKNSFKKVNSGLLESAHILGDTELKSFIKIVLPLAKLDILNAAILGFAHTIGEFGVVLMIGGNIPGKTQVMSIAIYEYVEALNYEKAHLFAGGLILTSMIMLGIIFYINDLKDRKYER